VERSPSDQIESRLGLEPTRSALAKLGPGRCAALVVAFVLLFVGLRSVHLDADPTTRFGMRASRELVAEPAAKSHEARNYALFGAYHLNPADEYQFWRAQSPIWVYPLTAFFKAFGVDWPQLRLFSTLYSALGFAAMLAIAVRFFQPWTVAFIGGLVALDGVYFHYARAGLLEPSVNTWLAVCMLALILAEHRRRWLIVAHWTFALAMFTKQAALVGLPVVLLATARVLWSPEFVGERRRDRWVVLANLVTVIVIAGIYIANSDYQRAVNHNLNHVLLGSDAPLEYRYRGLNSVFTRIVADDRYKHFMRTVPVSGVIGILASILLLVETVRLRRLPYGPMVIVGWFVCSLGAMLVIAWSAMRFWTVVVLPAALASGLVVEALLLFADRIERARLVTRLAVAGALIAIASQARYLYQPLFRPSYTLRDSAQAIVQTIGPREATVLGARSPPMVLGTPYKNYYVRSQFNATRERLIALAPTHFLFVAGGDGSNTIITRELPAVASSKIELLTLNVRGDNLILYEVDERVAGKTFRLPTP
jgi:4-amino-4-deoxy-L-arabinose transferase-like glycosyltransferase